MTAEMAVEHLQRRGVPSPAVRRDGMTWLVQSADTVIGRGPMLRLALEDAGHPYPVPAVRGVYSAHNSIVFEGGTEECARARSQTMALRIANALNRYTPNKRGV